MVEAMPYAFEPIGTFHADAQYAYDVPRQGALAANTGRIELVPGRGFEQATAELAGFSRIWVLYVFDRNAGHWRPRVLPPRHSTRRVGLFATRSPYRPNPIGLSCVELVAVNGLAVTVRGHDLLDGTPVLDLKPYLPYADAFPDAAIGWAAAPDDAYAVSFAPAAEADLAWLERHGVPCLRGFILDHLATTPLDRRRHRLVSLPDGATALAYRTWRAPFTCDEAARTVTVQAIRSAYAPCDLVPDAPDPYRDKELHRQFLHRPAPDQ